MQIGVIGYGTVGQAIAQAFSQQNHVIKWHDKHRADSQSLESLLDCDFVFICVNTDTVDGICDTSNVVSSVGQLAQKNYAGVVIIKSTVTPGTTQNLMSQHPDLKINFVPEFLHQAYAFEDFVNTDMLIVGGFSSQDYKSIVDLHAPYIKQHSQMSPTEAEIVKYFNNNFNALRVVFANAYYEVCQLLGANYDTVLKGAMSRTAIGSDSYLKCNEALRGYGGKCLPKDMEAFSGFLKQHNLPVTLFDAVIRDNEYWTKK